MESRQAIWLNGLSERSRGKLYDLLISSVQVRDKVNVLGDVAALIQLNNFLAPVRTGLWYKDLVTCKVVELGGMAGHPRWQVRIGGTPSAHSIGGRLREILAINEWEGLRQLAPSSGQVKLNMHHIAYGCSDYMSQEPLPVNPGRGGSVSHLCDTLGCIRVDHLRVTVHHVHNLSRQRCQGILLLTYMGEVILEKPCIHAGEGSLEELLESSCRQVSYWELSDAEAGRVSSLHQVLFEAIFSNSQQSNADLAQELSSQLDVPVEDLEAGLERLRGKS